MTVDRDHEPEINIYNREENIKPAKRLPPKQQSKGKPSKRPRIASSSNEKHVRRTNKATAEGGSNRKRESDVSYRHLFSFTNASETEKQSQEDDGVKKAKPTFSFLNEDDKNRETETEKISAEFRFLHEDEGYKQNRMQARNSAPDCDDAMEADGPSGSTYETGYSDKRRLVNGHRNAEGRRFTSPMAYRQRTQQVEMTVPQSSDTLVIPEDVDSRPNELLRIAARFCRQKSIEQLEEEWCAPGGIRETMKRDFKQKRQNVAKGRKLGSSRKR